MWVNDDGLVVSPADIYISIVNGTQYPRNWDKSTISELHLVTETAKPTDPTLKVTGFTVNGSYEQVWTTVAKTQEELDSDLAEAKINKTNEIMASWAAVAFAPIMFTAAGSTSKSYDADITAMTNIMQVLTLTGETPTGFYWRLADNSREEPFLKSDVQGLADAIGVRNIPYFQNRSDKKDAIEAATTIAAVNAITW